MKAVFLFFLISAYILPNYQIPEVNKSEADCTFNFRLNSCMVYSHMDEEGEYPMYSIYSMNLQAGKKEIIDSAVMFNLCVKTSDSTMLYVKSDELFSWNSNTKKKSTFQASKKIPNIIGAGYNKNNRLILLAGADYKSSTVEINIIDDQKKVIFSSRIPFDEIESEGIIPHIESVADYLFVKVLYKLVMIDLRKRKPVQTEIADNCIEFAPDDTSGVLYYQFDEEGKSVEYYHSFGSRQTKRTAGTIKPDIFAGMGSYLLTANIDDKLVPVYLAYDTAFIFSDFKWNRVPSALIYKDNKLTIKLPYTKQKQVDMGFFQWILQGQ